MAKYSFTVYGQPSVYYGQVDNNRAYYNVNLRANPYNYASVFIEWGSLLTDPNDPAPTHWKLTKNYYGAPDSDVSGVIVSSGLIGRFDLSALDEDVIENRQVTYSLWVFNGQAWINCGNASAVVVPFEDNTTLDKVMGWIPAAWLDQDMGTGDALGVAEDITLKTLLSAYSFAYDKFRTEARLLENSISYKTTPTQLLKNKVTDRGFTYEPTLGDTYHRGVYRASEVVNSKKGTISGIISYGTALAHWGLRVDEGKNILLDYNDSSFETSIGHWVASAGSFISVAYNDSLINFGVSVNPPAPTIFNQKEMFAPRKVGFGAFTPGVTTATTLTLPGPSVDKVLYGIPVSELTRYRVTGYVAVKSATYAGTVNAVISWYDRTGTLISSTTAGTTITATTTWQQFSSKSDSGINGQLAPANSVYASVKLTFTAANAATVFMLDMIQFEVANVNSYFEDARKLLIYIDGDVTNYVRNPSFESNTNYWLALNGTMSTTSTPASAKVFGSKAGKLVTTSTQTAGFVSEWMPVDSNANYVVSGYVSSNAARTMRVRIEFSTLQSVEAQTSILNDEDGAYYPTTSYYVESEAVLLTSTAQRIHVSAVAPDFSSDAGPASAKVSFYSEDAQAGDIFYLDSVLMEDNTEPSTYFDGSGAPAPTNPLTSEYISSLECKWENTSSSSGRSYRWRNYFTKLARLASTLPTVLPTGISWELRDGHPTPSYGELTPNILQSPSFEQDIIGWSTSNSSLTRVETRGTLFDEYTTHGVAFGKVTSTSASTFGIYSENAEISTLSGYYTSVAIKPENTDSYGTYTLTVRYYDEANVLVLQKTASSRLIHLERWAFLSLYAQKSEIAGAYYAVVKVECTPDTPASGIVFYIDRVVFRK